MFSSRWKRFDLRVLLMNLHESDDMMILMMNDGGLYTELSRKQYAL